MSLILNNIKEQIEDMQTRGAKPKFVSMNTDAYGVLKSEIGEDSSRTVESLTHALGLTVVVNPFQYAHAVVLSDSLTEALLSENDGCIH